MHRSAWDQRATAISTFLHLRQLEQRNNSSATASAITVDQNRGANGMLWIERVYLSIEE